MEGYRVCQICNKSFSNGKAMGGHMRSHYAKLLLTTKSTPSSSSTLPFLKDPDLPSPYALDPIHDKLGSVSHGSDDNNTGRESLGEVVESPAESGQGSLVSDINFSDQECAKCLMMLSRDTWPNTEVEVLESEDEMIGQIQEWARSKGRFKCETCNKVFGSYQALGGHRAGHKKVKLHQNKEAVLKYRGSENYWSAGNGKGNEKIFKCPYCDKVFKSGQALGGHKKAHIQPTDNSSKQRRIGMIDLNELPETQDKNYGECKSVECMGRRRRRKRMIV